MAGSHRTALAVLGLLVLSVSDARAAEARRVHGATPRLQLEMDRAGRPVEIVSLPPDLVAVLAATHLEEAVIIDEWPVAPGERQPVALARHDVYAPDARVVVIDGRGETEVPRSPLRFFWGAVQGDPSRRVLVTLDPDSGLLEGLAVSPEGTHTVRPLGRDPGAGYRVSASAPAESAVDPAAEFVCGGSPSLPEAAPPTAADAAPRVPVTSVLSSLHTAVIAVDTDNELLLQKFSDNTASATSYIAQLVAGMNVVYERDLFVRLLQGYTILRVSSTPDPYPTTSADSTSTQLDEFTNYWKTNYADLPRALAMQLSGKSPNGNSAAGIAWLSTLCNTSYGYSSTRVFKFAGSTASHDVSIVAHEIGHNFGSRHTHCYPTPTTPIDTCYSGESGCYSGPTSCPAPFTIDPMNGGTVSNVRGTLMSYCHLLSGCSATAVFHPDSVDVIAPIVDTKVNVCVFPVGAAVDPTIGGVSPATGSTGGGTVVTITGTGFQSGATVSFADLTRSVAAAAVTFVSSSELRATTPAHAAGVTDVAVGNPNDRTARKASAFTFVAPPGAVVAGTKTVSGAYGPGGAVTYTIVLSNTGGGAQADNVGDELTDVLPSWLSLVSANATGGTAIATVASNTVTWNGSIASGSSVTITIQATVKGTTPSETVVSNQGTVRYDADANGSNETTVLTDDPALPGASDPTVFNTGTGFYTVTPCRVIDTRNAVGPTGGPALGANSTRSFPVTGGVCGIPSTAIAVSVNLTAVGAAAPGYLTLFPGDGAGPPLVSSVNFSPGLTRANNAIALLATNGTGTIKVKNGSAGSVHFVLDVNGYFQ